MPAHSHFDITLIPSSLIAWTLTLCFLAAPAHAQTLNSSTIEPFIASVIELQTILEGAEEGTPDETFEDEDDNCTDPTKAFTSLAKELGNHPPTKDKVSSMVKRHGFSSLAEWAQTGDRIYTAYMAINMEDQPMMDGMMDENAIEDYMASVGDVMSDARKKEIRAMMESAMKSNEAINNAPSEDIEAVRPYADKITAINEMDAAD